VDHDGQERFLSVFPDLGTAVFGSAQQKWNTRHQFLLWNLLSCNQFISQNLKSKAVRKKQTFGQTLSEPEQEVSLKEGVSCFEGVCNHFTLKELFGARLLRPRLDALHGDASDLRLESAKFKH